MIGVLNASLLNLTFSLPQAYAFYQIEYRHELTLPDEGDTQRSELKTTYCEVPRKSNMITTKLKYHDSLFRSSRPVSMHQHLPNARLQGPHFPGNRIQPRADADMILASIGAPLEVSD